MARRNDHVKRHLRGRQRQRQALLRRPGPLDSTELSEDDTVSIIMSLDFLNIDYKGDNLLTWSKPLYSSLG